jgi:20S proteasome alpha/beta subunit
MIESCKTKRKIFEWKTKVWMATAGEERVMQERRKNLQYCETEEVANNHIKV